MESITKNRVSEQQIIEMIKHTFGEEVSLAEYAELSEGYCNAAYRLRLSDDREMILKVSPKADVRMMFYETQLMRNEVMAMQLAREQGIPGVAEVYAYDDSRTICSGEYFFMEVLKGDDCHKVKPNADAKVQAALDEEIGKYIAGINAIKGEYFGHFCATKLQFDTWFETFYTYMKKLIADGLSVGITVDVPYEDILNKLKEHKHYFEEVKEPSLIHFDSWEGNIFIDGEKVVGMIDWERAMWAEGFLEDRFRRHSINDNFLRGYGKENLTDTEKVRITWYDIYMYLILTIEGEFRQYETTDQHDWAKGQVEYLWGKISQLD